MPIRVLDRHEVGKGSDVAKGIEFATAHGADVINLSLDFDPDVKHCEQIVSVCHAIQHATHEGVTVVAAAGNDDMSRVFYPAAVAGRDRGRRLDLPRMRRGLLELRHRPGPGRARGRDGQGA